MQLAKKFFFKTNKVGVKGRRNVFQLTLIDYFDKKYNILYEYTYILIING
jgi:hypothetical protein